MSDLNTILLVEDDKTVRMLLAEYLENDRFLILQADRKQRAIDILKNHKVNLVLLDLDLPDSKDINLVSDIRACTDTPILVVSGEQCELKKVKSLRLGADDFITKPVNLNMLSAKVKAHIRRYDHLTSMHKEQIVSSLQNQNIRFYKWALDRQRFQLFDENKDSANLTIQEFKILLRLIDNAGQTMSRHDLCDAIKEHNYIPSDRAIDVKITRIRKKIGDNATASKIIETVRGAGYMFNKNIID